MSTDHPVSVNPTPPKPEPKRERAKDHQLEAIAKLCSIGTPAGTMSAVTGLSESYINRLMTDKRNTKFNTLCETYQAKNLKQVVLAQFELADLIPEVLDAFRAGLQAQDLRLRKETGQWIWDKVIPDLNGKGGSDGTDVFQLTINQPHVQTQIGETMDSVAHALVGLREAVAGQDPNAHVLVGTDALPTPSSQLEVTEGVAPLTPTENPGTDLLTELVEREKDGTGS